MAYQSENNGFNKAPMVDVTSMNIKCSNPDCSKPDITELPFMPRGTDGIYCRTCLPKFRKPRQDRF